jgi:hypothetical protein
LIICSLVEGDCVASKSTTGSYTIVKPISNSVAGTVQALAQALVAFWTGLVALDASLRAIVASYSSPSAWIWRWANVVNSPVSSLGILSMLIQWHYSALIERHVAAGLYAATLMGGQGIAMKSRRTFDGEARNLDGEDADVLAEIFLAASHNHMITVRHAQPPTRTNCCPRRRVLYCEAKECNIESH